MQKSPKYKVDDIVITPPNLYDETSGKIIEVERIFKEIDSSGRFDPNGLCTLESTISGISIPYTFDGEKLIISYPHRARTSIFYGYSYVVSTPKMCSIFSEKSIRKI